MTATTGSELLLAPDGAALATDVRLPTGPGPFPTVMIRTPYDRRRHLAEARAWNRRGYAAVVQDVRGRFASQGVWAPYRHEKQDGAATARWIAARPWSDGRVVASGASYAAHTAAEAAAGAPATVVGAALLVPALGLGETARRTGTLAELEGHLWWWSTYGDTRSCRGEDLLDRAAAQDPGLWRHLPVSDLPRRLNLDLPGFAAAWDMGQHAVDRLSAALTCPVLLLGGWQDPFTGTLIDLAHGLGTPPTLVIGPWGHGLGLDEATAAEATDDEEPSPPSAGAVLAGWVEDVLRGGPRRLATVHVAGAGWRTVETVPAPHPVDIGWSTVGSASLVDDPERPVPSRAGPGAQPCADDEDDRLVVLRSDRVGARAELAGRGEVRFRDDSSGPGHDWVVRLAVESPGRPRRELALGSTAVLPSSTPGTAVQVSLSAFATRIEPEDRLVLILSGSWFPRFPRNPHTGEDPLTAVTLVPAVQRVDPKTFRLLLPVLGET